MTTRLFFISSLLISLLVITPESKAQNTAVMNVSAKIVTGGTVSSQMNQNIDLQEEIITLGNLNLIGTENHDYLISFDKAIQVSNKNGEAIQMTTTFSQRLSELEGVKYYTIKGKVKEKAEKGNGFYKGRINATINYL